MEVVIINGKWTLNNKTYAELYGRERRIFEVLMAIKQVNTILASKRIIHLQQ